MLLYTPHFFSIYIMTRMQYILPFFIISLAVIRPIPALEAKDCKDKSPCPAGCYLFGMGQSCTICANGTYTTANNSTECKPCNNKPNDQAAYTSPGTVANNCSWKLTCDKGTYWDKDKKSCAPCNTYYTTPNSMVITGDLKMPDTDNTCTGKIYTLNLKSETACPQTPSPNKIYVKYDAGFNSSSNPTTWVTDPTTITNNTVKNCFGYSFNGYYTSSTNGTPVIGIHPSQLVTSKTVIKALFKNDDATEADLYATWSPRTYTISYKEPTMADTRCTYGSSNCQLRRPSSNQIPSGKTFKGWQCTSGCADNDYIIEPTSGNILVFDYKKISTSNTNLSIELQAVFNDCPAGYYCNENGQQPCPAGATSNTAAAHSSDCYISSSTKFCDSVGCFTLPIKDKINGAISTSLPTVPDFNK